MPGSDPHLDTRAELVVKQSFVSGVNVYRKAISQNIDQSYISSREVVATRLGRRRLKWRSATSLYALVANFKKREKEPLLAPSPAEL